MHTFFIFFSRLWFFIFSLSIGRVYITLFGIFWYGLGSEKRFLFFRKGGRESFVRNQIRFPRAALLFVITLDFCHT
ncbi:hypothetical protein QBC43DRAFT_312844 [Cladorrhinum sp. PSN259]|nr:hypothetical protein QBC43DRAFT_312844 [Cladorrhinum sp. PSN259]